MLSRRGHSRRWTHSSLLTPTTLLSKQPTMTRPARQWSCPEHIVQYVESVTSLPGQRAIVSRVEEVKSAQQRVYLVSIDFHGTPSSVNNAPATDTIREEINTTSFHRALIDGGNRLVVRLWKASARWWNLNTNEASSGESGAIRMARSEVAGYRVARAAIAATNKKRATSSSLSKVTIPEVLYFSHDYRKHCDGRANSNSRNKTQQPYAIMTYVGDGSSYFCVGHSNSNNDWACDSQYAKDMIRVRHEYGFDEPHPRHGRVKEDKALEYALNVMNTVVLPMQTAFFSVDDGIMPSLGKEYEQDLRVLGKMGEARTEPYQYNDMVDICRNAAAQMKSALQKKGIGADNSTIGNLVSTLCQCIEALSTESKKCCWLNSKAVTPALCHIDLQPQNLILCRRKKEVSSANIIPHVSSVLDWEEACYADPRFEVLLMGRKVCANRKQADRLWAHYSQYLKEKHRLEVGPIEPWLKLEATHSITTLLMQSMDLVGGGRSPWESKPDLLGKIKREFSRLKVLGWDFVAPCASA